MSVCLYTAARASVSVYRGKRWVCGCVGVCVSKRTKSLTVYRGKSDVASFVLACGASPRKRFSRSKRVCFKLRPFVGVVEGDIELGALEVGGGLHPL